MRVKNFLKSDRQHHKDPQVRLERIRALDAADPQSQLAFAEFAVDDDDLMVRLAAIERLNELSILRQLLDANGDDASDIRAQAEARIAHRLEASELGDNDVQALLESHADRLAVAITVHSSVASQRLLAMARIGDEQGFLHVVQQSRFHDARLAAAEHLSQHDVLRAALTACRSRDKVVAKMIQQQLDKLAAAEAELIASRHAVTTTLTAMQSLAQSVWSPQHSGRHKALQSRWDALDTEHRKESEAAFTTASDQVVAMQTRHDKPGTDKPGTDKPGTDHGSDDDKSADGQDTDGGATAGVVGAEAVSNAGSADAAVNAATARAPEITDPQAMTLMSALGSVSIDALPDTLKSAVTTETVSPEARSLLAHGNAVAVMFDPPFELSKARPGVLQQRIKRVDTLLDTNATLPGFDVSELQYIQEFQHHREALVQRLEKARQESTDRIKATHRQFAALASAFSEGKWGPANSMLRRLQKKIGAMEPAERATLADKLQRAEKQLADMSDWQDFAARPKLEVLCDQMEALPARDLKPEALAKEVKSLQAQWKALGVSRASNELWSRFKTAGDVAYEPCKAHFELKQAERQAKLDAKVGLCNDLEEKLAAIEWATADWKAVQRMINDAKRDWSKNRIPDRKPDKALESRFSDILKPLDARLTEQYDANAEQKRELIDKAQKIAEGEINQHSINRTRSLQSAWKQVGVMRRKEDQVLWESFNTHCRAIFKHQHEAEREQYKAGMAHVFRARDIIKTLKQIAKKSAPDDQQVQALSTEFQALADFPDKDKKFLLRDFRGAMDACSKIQQTQSRRREQAEHDELLRRVSLCEQLEAAVESPEMNSDTLRDDVKHAWEASDVKANRELAVLIDKRRDAALAHLEANTQYNYATTESDRRDVLIRMEIIAGIETPTEDKSRRMQYQLANLQEGMTSAGVADERTVLSDLEQQWLGMLPAPRQVQDALQSRFLKAVGR